MLKRPVLFLAMALAASTAAAQETPSPSPSPSPGEAPADAAVPATDPVAAPAPTPPPAEPTAAPAETTATKPAEATPPAAPTRPKNVVTINVPSNVFGAFSLEFGRVLTDHTTLILEPTYFFIGPQEGFSRGITGPGLVIGTMIHPFADAPDGLFVMPEFYVTHLNSLGDDFGPDLGLGFGAVGGYSMRFFDALMISVGLGATANVLGYAMSGERGFGVMPILRANVGVTF